MCLQASTANVKKDKLNIHGTYAGREASGFRSFFPFLHASSRTELSAVSNAAPSLSCHLLPALLPRALCAAHALLASRGGWAGPKIRARTRAWSTRQVRQGGWQLFFWGGGDVFGHGFSVVAGTTTTGEEDDRGSGICFIVPNFTCRVSVLRFLRLQIGPRLTSLGPWRPGDARHRLSAERVRPGGPLQGKVWSGPHLHGLLSFVLYSAFLCVSPPPPPGALVGG